MTDDTTSMLRDAVARLLRDRASVPRTLALEAQGIDAALWDHFAALGLRGDDNGVELDAQMAVLQEIGRAGALLPYAESEVLGRALARAAGLETGAATLAVLPEELHAETVAGGFIRLHLPEIAVAQARHAERVLARCRLEGRLCLAELPGRSLGWHAQANLAAEPRDLLVAAVVDLDEARIHPMDTALDAGGLQALGALCRVALMVGALGTVLELTVGYAQDRKQFGKSLSQFQVIQSYLAEMAAETCAAAVAHDLALAGAMRGDWGDVAVAKIRAGQAAGTVARLAHQVHGAIGMTREYPLNLWTRRLWAWRDEDGNEAFWSARLGASLVAQGAASFWPRMAGATLPLALAAGSPA